MTAPTKAGEPLHEMLANIEQALEGMEMRAAPVQLAAISQMFDRAKARAVAQEAEGRRLRDAATLKRNVIIWGDESPSPRFTGRWVAIPQEDFDQLRAALSGSSETQK